MTLFNIPRDTQTFTVGRPYTSSTPVVVATSNSTSETQLLVGVNDIHIEISNEHRRNKLLSGMKYTMDTDSKLRIHFTVVKEACVPNIRVDVYRGDPSLLAPTVNYDSPLTVQFSTASSRGTNGDYTILLPRDALDADIYATSTSNGVSEIINHTDYALNAEYGVNSYSVNGSRARLSETDPALASMYRLSKSMAVRR